MKSCNSIIPSIDIERHLLACLTDVLENSIPVCLYTYATARAVYNEEFYIRSKEENSYSYDVIYQIVSDLYGRDRMDNKITLEFIYNNKGTPLPIYVSYYDGSIVISTEVAFLNSVDGDNSYRVVLFDGVKF